MEVDDDATFWATISVRNYGSVIGEVEFFFFGGAV